jgi:hypothetical protein
MVLVVFVKTLKYSPVQRTMQLIVNIRHGHEERDLTFITFMHEEVSAGWGKCHEELENT